MANRAESINYVDISHGFKSVSFNCLRFELIMCGVQSFDGVVVPLQVISVPFFQQPKVIFCATWIHLLCPLMFRQDELFGQAPNREVLV